MRKWKPLLLLSSVLMISSCASPTPFGTLTPSAVTNAPDQVAKVCTVLKPIIYSRLHDTVGTIKQIQTHNAAYLALCPQG